MGNNQKNNSSLIGFAEIMEERKNKPQKKAPTYQWQELALNIISDLSIPPSKKNSVFKVCKQYSRAFILASLNDTKELCHSGERWKYFFKIVNQKKSR